MKSLDSCSNYSTTRFLTEKLPNIINYPGDKYNSLIFSPHVINKEYEGGLRTLGYFKSDRAFQPLITIITVVYNGHQYLEETILSVLNQSYSNVEYLIIDGGSSDGTLDIIRKYDHAIDYWISEKDKGMYDAINKGIILSLGSLINFTNSDDYLYSNKSLTMIANIAKIDSEICIYGKGAIVGEKGEVLFIKNPLKYNKRYFKTLGLFFTQPTFFWSRKLIKRVGLINLTYSIAADYEFISRLCLNSNKVYKIEEVLCAFRVHGNSFGDSNTECAKKEFQLINESLELKSNFALRVIDRIFQKFNNYIGLF